MKIGILVVAYNAESTIKETVSRVPKTFIESANKVLISDDKSVDSTSNVANELKNSADHL